jgi:DNA-binding beta-propeller fold protein YncE
VTRLARILLSGAALGAASPPTVPYQTGPVLRVVADVPLPGRAVRFDYQSMDPAANRLYLNHMNAGQLIVFDLKDRRVAGVVDNLPGATGVWVVPELGKVYVSVTGRHEVAVIDARSLHIVARMGGIGFPDGIGYAPEQKKIYVSDESGGGELVIDGTSNRMVTRIPLGGEAGNTIYDAGSRHILVAVQTKNQVGALDPATDSVIGRYDLEGARHPHGMALDAARRLLFVANEGNGTLLTVDLRTMRVLGTQRVGEGPDVLAFDPAWHRLYVASESGVVSVFTERDNGLVHDGDVTIPRAHTVSVDPRTHLVYLPLENVGGHPVLRIMAASEPAPKN